MDLFSRPRRLLALGTITLIALIHSSPAPVAAQGPATLMVSEVHPSGSGTAYAADWFEVTNTGTTAVDITGWKMDDNSNAFGSALAFRGVTEHSAGQVGDLLRGPRRRLDRRRRSWPNFSTAWFGTATPPAGLLIGAYGGSGVGLSAGGDAVNLFDAAGDRVTGVSFGAATAAATFDNAGRRRHAPLPTSRR